MVIESHLHQFQIQNQEFQGPLEQLVDLIRKRELNIFEVSLAQLAADFTAYIEKLPQFDLDGVGEYLVIASWLIKRKSSEMLPEETVAEEPENDEENEKERLAQRIRDLARFQELARQLRHAEAERRACYTRRKLPSGYEAGEIEFYDLSPTDLCLAFKKVVQEIGHGPTLHDSIEFTVDEKIAELEMLLSDHGQLCLTLYLESCSSRMEIIVTFLALLELMRCAHLRARQVQGYGDIWIHRVHAPSTPSSPDQLETDTTSSQDLDTDHEKKDND